MGLFWYCILILLSFLLSLLVLLPFLLAQLLPEAKKAELEQTGIKVIAFQMPSRKNPKLLSSNCTLFHAG